MSAPAFLFLIRHGQTGGNGQRYVGREDVPLDATGRHQARTLGALLAAEPIDRLFSSPLSRARETAAPLAAQLGLAIELRDELQEIDYGAYQGLLKADQPLKLRHAHRFERMPGGESLFDVYERIGRAGGEFARLLASGANVAVVGHFWSLRMLVGVLQGIGFESLFEQTRYKPGNGSVHEIEFLREAGGIFPVATRWLRTTDDTEGEHESRMAACGIPGA